MRVGGSGKMVDRRQALIEVESREAGHSRGHSRSASWSFTGGRSGSTGDLGSLITGSAITMIREVLPVSLTDESTQGNEVPLTPRTRGTTTLGQGFVGIPHRTGIVTGEGSSEQIGSRSASLSQIVEDSGSEDGVSQVWTQQAPPFTPTAATPSAEQAESLPEAEGNEIITWMEQNALFLFVIFVKIAWSYKFALSVLFGLGVAYLHANRTICKQVSRGDQRSMISLFLIIVFLVGNIQCVYFVMADSRLYYCLLFQPPHVTPTLINTVWCICVTDFIIRFGAMTLKAALCLVSPCLIRSRKKGKAYMLLEYACLLYRSVVTAPLWVRYLSTIYSDEEGTDQDNKTVAWIFAVVVTAVYLMVKGANLFVRLKEFWNALIIFFTEKAYGTRPSSHLVDLAGGNCPICQEEYKDPVLLSCRHIFCEECVMMWFDRERSCPMCRATISSNPKWRDGSTSAIVQLF